jgi:integrase/recombinase XerD
MRKRFESYVSEKGVKENEHTAGNYHTTLNHLDSFLNQENLEELDFGDVPNLVSYFKNLNINEDTAGRYVGYLAGYYEEQGREDIADELRDYTFSSTSFTAKSGFARKYVTKKEYSVMRANTENTRENLILQILWECGLRASELADLRVNQVIRDENKMRVETAKIPPESDRDKVRKVYYHRSLNKTLREWLDYGARDQYSTAENSPYLVVSQNSGNVTANWINTVIRRIADRAEITRVRGKDGSGRDQHFPTAHSLRHSYGTYRASNGINLEKLRVLMGHGDLEEVVTYVTMLDDDLEEANKTYRPADIDHTRELVKNI